MSSTNPSSWPWLSRVATIALVLCSLSSSTPAAPQTIVTVANESITSFSFWYHANGLAKLIQGLGLGNAPGQEKQSDRDVKITRVQIFPSDVTVDLSDHVRFSVVAYDRDGNVVGGAKIKWSGQGASPKERAHVSRTGSSKQLRLVHLRLPRNSAREQRKQRSLFVPDSGGTYDSRQRASARSRRATFLLQRLG